MYEVAVVCMPDKAKNPVPTANSETSGQNSVPYVLSTNVLLYENTS